MYRQISCSSRSQRGFTLVEAMIVMGIIVIVVAIAAPTWLRQRENSRARACQQNLVRIDHAAEMYAIEFKLQNGAAINFPNDLVDPPGTSAGQRQGFLRAVPVCPASGNYTCAVIGDTPVCSIGSSNAPFEAHVKPN